jgi:hypothetical protein
MKLTGQYLLERYAHCVRTEEPNGRRQADRRCRIGAIGSYNSGRATVVSRLIGRALAHNFCSMDITCFANTAAGLIELRLRLCEEHKYREVSHWTTGTLEGTEESHYLLVSR